MDGQAGARRELSLNRFPVDLVKAVALSRTKIDNNYSFKDFTTRQADAGREEANTLDLLRFMRAA
jgi:hypothetical protein